MNRRSFLSRALGAAVAAVVPAPILKLVLPKQIDMGFVGPFLVRFEAIEEVGIFVANDLNITRIEV